MFQLQKYSLHVAYKKPKEIYMAHTLSFQRLTEAGISQKNWRKSITEHSTMSVMIACNTSNMPTPITQYYNNSEQPYAGDNQRANQKFQN